MTRRTTFCGSKDRHNLTFGFQWQTLQDNETFALDAAFTFSNNETAQFVNGALSRTTGLAYASYLLGMVDSSTNTQDSVAETGGRYKTYAWYVQDDFKVNSRLTLNLGLRWNIWSPFTEVVNRMSFFNPTLANPIAGDIPGALQFAGNGTDSCNCATPSSSTTSTPGLASGSPTAWARRPSFGRATAYSTRTPAAWEGAPTDARG